MAIIDVHTHAYTREYLALLRARGEPYHLKVRPDGKEEIFRGETPIAYPHQVHDAPGMFAKSEAMEPDQRHAIREGNARRLFRI